MIMSVRGEMDRNGNREVIKWEQIRKETKYNVRYIFPTWINYLYIFTKIKFVYLHF